MIANVEPTERRRQPRLQYSWETSVTDTHTQRTLMGRMVDLNSRGAAFLLDNAHDLLPGQELEISLNYPKVFADDFQIVRTRTVGQVVRIDHYNPQLKRIAVCFRDTLNPQPTEENHYLLAVAN